MSTPITDLSVTIVSTDRELLCNLSWTLSLFGYQVTATCDFSDESPCRRNKQPGLLLLDTRENKEAAELLALPRTPEYVYRIAIDRPDAAERLVLDGADDVIRFPVNTGELLTRLRAGVRRLEFENRLAGRARRDALTGLLTRRGLAKLLGDASQPPTTCVAFGIDYLDQIQQQYGDHAAQHLKTTLARCMQQDVEEGELCGLLEDNVLLATLNRGADAARQFADSVAAAFSASDTLVREIRSLPTLSAIIAEWDTSIAAGEQLGRCESTLQQVRWFGGNHIAMAADVQGRIAEWRADMDAGVPFEDAVAQDMMELFPAILTCDQLDSGYEASLAAPTLQLPCLPVVDDEGKLDRVIHFADPQLGLPSGSSQPHTIEHHQPLSELFEAFNTTDSDYLVVVDQQQRPIGYLTCEGLASLVLDQMHADRYRSLQSAESSTASLVVPVVPNRAAAPHMAGASH